ncbi:MAG: hypothetical protein ACLRZ9_09155 [Eubacterium sp.]
MKETYVSPEITILEFEAKDIITTSGGILEDLSFDNDNSNGGYSMDY